MTALVCHPSTPTSAVRSVEATGSRTAAGDLHLSFRLHAPLARLRIPAPTRPAIALGLWRHTCFEAFLGCEGTPAYHELNLSPSGEWAVFAFARYRDGGPVPDPACAPRIAVRTGTDRLELDAEVALDALSPAYRRAALRLALTAVIEDDDGACSYWSLRHPPGEPDFHHETSFVLRLEPAGAAC